jgi:hypothetical protein
MQNNTAFTLQENCALLGYYTVSSGNFLPKFRDIYWSHLQGQESKTLSQKSDNTTTCCVITQKSTVLIYFMVGAWNHALTLRVRTSLHYLTRVQANYWFCSAAVNYVWSDMQNLLHLTNTTFYLIAGILLHYFIDVCRCIGLVVLHAWVIQSCSSM